eukprot:2236770-Rhodomonas_salina.2
MAQTFCSQVHTLFQQYHLTLERDRQGGKAVVAVATATLVRQDLVQYATKVPLPLLVDGGQPAAKHKWTGWIP